MQEQLFFNSKFEIHHAKAPGRMDVMGGVADYSGALLLQKPIRKHAFVQIQKREDGWLKIYSQEAEESGYDPLVRINLTLIIDDIQNADWQNLKKVLKVDRRNLWHLYISGCFFNCIHKKLIDNGGANVYLTSNVPIGKGLSSSAAIECATLRAIEIAYNFLFPNLELPLNAQYVENKIVGAPCGLMDQLTSHFGENDGLLPIVCQPASVFPVLNIPDGLQFVAIDSGIKHSVAGEAYGQARTAAFMGYSVIAQYAGISIEDIKNARESEGWSSLPYKGYLANISRQRFTNEYKFLLNNETQGSDFISRFSTTIDNNTLVDPDTIYKVRDCTAHPIFENARITSFFSILKFASEGGELSTYILNQLGMYMYASHQSYSRCGLGHPVTDKIVSLIKSYGPEKGLFGARISGGGSGGTVIAMIYGNQGVDTLENLCARHSFTILDTPMND